MPPRIRKQDSGASNRKKRKRRDELIASQQGALDKNFKKNKQYSSSDDEQNDENHTVQFVEEDNQDFVNTKHDDNNEAELFDVDHGDLVEETTNNDNVVVDEYLGNPVNEEHENPMTEEFIDGSVVFGPTNIYDPVNWDNRYFSHDLFNE